MSLGTLDRFFEDKQQIVSELRSRLIGFVPAAACVGGQVRQVGLIVIAG